MKLTNWIKVNLGPVFGFSVIVAGVVALVSQLPAQGPADAQKFLDANCILCHSERSKAGGVVLEKAALQPIGPHAELWERVIRKVEAGEMPPPSVPRRPDPKEAAAFIAGLTQTLDQYAMANPDPGRPTLRRLTRTQYSNAMRDLLAVDVKPGEELPADTLANGFNNNGDALSLSPLLLEKYVSMARQVARLALGDPSLPRLVHTYTPPARQDSWMEGLPFGTRGMPAVNHYFPSDGEYRIRVFTDLYDGGKLPDDEGKRLFQTRTFITAGHHKVGVMIPEEGAVAQGPIPDIPGWAGGLGGVLDPLRTATRRPVLDIRIDGDRIKRFDIDPPTSEELATPVTVTPGVPWLRSVEIDGPYNPAGPGNTESRTRLLVCRPKSAGEETSCASKILSNVARRAFRRDVSAKEVEPFLAIYKKARVQSDFEGSIEEALEGVLVSPYFLFRIEDDPANIKPGQSYSLGGYEMASRLSFLLWNSIPDDALLDAARSGRLTSQDGVAREAKRMLADRRASALVDDFGMQFLGLADLDSMQPDPFAYPNFNPGLRSDMGEEARLFLRDVFLGNRSVVDMVGANYSFLNERLADHYGVKGVYGPAFRRVEFAADSPRGGILGMGAFLLATSHSNITSPVLRGKWVLANLLDQPPSPPPPGVPTLVETNPSGKRLTGRQQMEQHRSSPACSSCHARMDPFGFALENFDVVGVWRTQDEGGDVNPTATMSDGGVVSGPGGLKQRLLSRPDFLARAFTERLMTYALGRKLAASDAATVRRIVADAAPSGFRFNDLVLEVIESPQFRMRRKEIDNVR